MDLFGLLNNISQDKVIFKHGDDVYEKPYTNFMINRYISTSEMFLPIIAELNHFNLPKHVHNRFLCNVLPKRKQFFDYSKIKSKKDELSKNLPFIAKYFEISLKDAEHYCEFLSKEHIIEITKKYNK